MMLVVNCSLQGERDERVTEPHAHSLDGCVCLGFLTPLIILMAQAAECLGPGSGRRLSPQPAGQRGSDLPQLRDLCCLAFFLAPHTVSGESSSSSSSSP